MWGENKMADMITKKAAAATAINYIKSAKPTMLFGIGISAIMSFVPQFYFRVGLGAISIFFIGWQYIILTKEERRLKNEYLETDVDVNIGIEDGNK